MFFGLFFLIIIFGQGHLRDVFVFLSVPLAKTLKVKDEGWKEKTFVGFGGREGSSRKGDLGNDQ